MKNNILKCTKVFLAGAMIVGLLLMNSILIDAETTHSHVICGAECKGHADNSNQQAADDNYKINYVPGKLKVITDDTVKAADGILNELNKFKEESVTSADKEAIQSLNEKIDSLLKKDGITVNGKRR